MDTLAALMVLIACPPDTARCLEEPIAVVSYHSTQECRLALPGETAKAEKLARIIYGNCIPVDPALLAGRPQINRTIDPARLAGLSKRGLPAVEAQALANTAKAEGPFALVAKTR
ncbi:hypothetical protein [Rhizobium cremeum]|uniref:hypothetical protein n=1 Tax=Rhizobium cremeum TaxID=2813827 RepID=UPI000DDF6A7C